MGLLSGLPVAVAAVAHKAQFLPGAMDLASSTPAKPRGEWPLPGHDNRYSARTPYVSVLQTGTDGNVRHAVKGNWVFELPFGRAHLEPWPHIPRDGTGLGTVGLAVLSRFPAQMEGRLAIGMVAGDFTPERGGLHVLLDVDGTKVDLVGVHLTSRLPYGPPIQLRRLHPQLPPPGRPAIVAGDCNFWGPGVQAFFPGWQRTVRGRTWPARRR